MVTDVRVPFSDLFAEEARPAIAPACTTSVHFQDKSDDFEELRRGLTFPGRRIRSSDWFLLFDRRDFLFLLDGLGLCDLFFGATVGKDTAPLEGCALHRAWFRPKIDSNVPRGLFFGRSLTQDASL